MNNKNNIHQQMNTQYKIILKIMKQFKRLTLIYLIANQRKITEHKFITKNKMKKKKNKMNQVIYKKTMDTKL